MKSTAQVLYMQCRAKLRSVILEKKKKKPDTKRYKANTIIYVCTDVTIKTHK